MSEEEKKVFTSLADFAAMTTEAVPVVMSRLPAAGTFICRGAGVSVTMKDDDPDKDPFYTVVFSHEVLKAEMLADENLDPESFVGKVIRERYPVWPNNMVEVLGLVRGMYKKIGLPNEGSFGGVEGEEPGFLDGLNEEAVYGLKINHSTGKNDQENAYFNWKRLDDEMYEAMGLPNPFVES